MQSPEAASRSHTNAISEHSDQILLLVEEVVDYAIFTLDVDGRIATWNAGAKRITQYEPLEIIGRHLSILYVPEDIQAQQPEWEIEVAQREGRFEVEGWRTRKDGSRFWANVVITAIRDNRGRLIGYGKVIRDFSQQREQAERLKQSEERFRLLVEGVQDYAIFMMDSGGYVTTWNSGAEKIKGYQASDILGKHYSTFFLKEDVIARKPAAILETAAREGDVEVEGWRVRKDGSRFWVNALVTALRGESGNLIGFSKITRDVTEKMQQQEALRKEIAEKEKTQHALAKSEKSLRQLSLSLLRTQDEERKRIGREMHDSLGQYLSVLKIKLGALKIREKNLSAEGSEELARLSTLLEECVKEVRTISYLLYPPMLEEMGLRTAIPWYLDGFSERSGIKATFDAPSEVERVPRHIELALFRVLQEALTNVHKHSESPNVDICLSQTPSGIVLEVRDYGKGLPQAVVNESNSNWSGSLGVGLRGMSERMVQLGGKLIVTSGNPGTLLRAEVPQTL